MEEKREEEKRGNKKRASTLYFPGPGTYSRLKAIIYVAACIFFMFSTEIVLASDSDNPHLSEAMRHIEKGDLEKALSALDRAMAHPENTNNDLVEIYATLAVVYLYTGSESSAYEAYVRLLNIDPRYNLPDHTAAPLQDLFNRVSQAYEDGRIQAVRVAHDPPGRISHGSPVVLSSVITNLPSHFRAHVKYRFEGEWSYSSLPLSVRPGHRWVASLPQVFSEKQRESEEIIEYYIEVVNERGHRVQGAGSARAPYRLLLFPDMKEETETAPSWYQRPWVWIIVGGVMVGSAGAVYLGAKSGSGGNLPVRIIISEDL